MNKSSMIRVSHRRTLIGATEEQVTAYLRCPTNGGMVELEQCFECGQNAGLIVDSDGAQSGRLRARCSAACVGPSALGAKVDPGRVLLTPVARVMRADLTCFSANVPLSRVREALVDGGFSGAPVVDAEGHPIGVISLTDLVRAGSASDDQPVEQLMTPVVCTLPETAELARAAAVMAFEGIHRVLIVSSTRRVVGIVTALDVMHALAQSAGFMVPEDLRLKKQKSAERRS